MKTAARLFLIVTLVGAPATFTAPALANPIYAGTDKEGRTVYTSKPPSKEAVPLNLPEIQREKKKVIPTRGTTCASHGGTDCEAGRDDDGSVICYDGFREAVTRFKLTCLEAKLEVSEIAPGKNPGAFMVFVRNKRAVPAEEVVVTVNRGPGKKIVLTGPTSIEGFGLGEYGFAASTPVPLPLLSEVRVSCKNCPQA